MVRGQCWRPAPPVVYSKKTGEKTTERRGEKACELRCERQIIYPSVIINSPAAVLSRPTVSSSAPLVSALSNDWQ